MAHSCPMCTEEPPVRIVEGTPYYRCGFTATMKAPPEDEKVIKPPKITPKHHGLGICEECGAVIPHAQKGNYPPRTVCRPKNGERASDCERARWRRIKAEARSHG